MNNKPNSIPLYVVNTLSLAFAVFLIFVWCYFVYAIIPGGTDSKLVANSLASASLPDVKMFNELDLHGKAYVVWDVSRERIIYGTNENMQLPLASLTKLMTVLVATEMLPKYYSIHGEGTLKNNWSLGDLSAYTLVTSSNNGATAIAVAVDDIIQNQSESNLCDTVNTSCNFVTLMTDRAADLGLEQTYFTNPTGLDNESGSSGGYGSAVDVAKLLSYISINYPSILKPTTKNQYLTVNEAGFEIVVGNTHSEVETIPGVLGSKTGLTDFAGGNLGIVFDAGFDEPYALVILGSTEAGRFEDMDKLIGATRKYLVVNSRLQ